MGFLSGLQIGANIGNMRVAQQERMMQLRSQAALQAVQERQLAAQADMLAQHAQFYKEQAQKLDEAEKNQEAFKAAVGDQFKQNLVQSMDPETGEYDMPTAIARTHAVLSRFDPKMANDWAETQAKVFSEGRKGIASNTAFNPIAKPVLDESGKPIIGADGKPMMYLQKGPNSGELLESKVDNTPADVKTAKYLAGLKSQLAEENNSLLESGIGEPSADATTKRAKIARIQNEITALEPKKPENPLNTKLELVKQANNAVAQAASNGDADSLAEAIAERDRTEALVYPKGTKLQDVNAITGKPEARVVGGTTAAQDEISAKVRSDLQTKINGVVQAAKTLHDLDSKINWSTVGPVAWTLEKAGRYGPGSLLGIAGRAGTPGRTEIKGAVLDLMNELETKGHASKTVLDEIRRTLPSMGFFEDPESARASVQERKRSFIVDGLTASKQLGVKPPAELMQLLSTYPSKELQRMASTGIISPEDASAAFALQLQAHPRNPNVTPTPQWVK